MSPIKKHINWPTFFILFVPFLFLLSSCQPEYSDDIEHALAALNEEIEFNNDVQPILSDRCFTCHGPDEGKRKAHLRLDRPEYAFAALSKSGNYAIKKGNLAKSQLVHRIISEDPENAMPPATSDLRLSVNEKAILIKWVQQGAPYTRHWAYIPPKHSDPPTNAGSNSSNHPIDGFIQKELDKVGWKLSPKATKEDLLRRVTLDITGLPPTIKEMDAFLADTSERAIEKVLDHLLTSPHYGERMAADWLDAARFADTHGYTVDRYRDMSPWRDWVIDAFNKNLPYDTFITWQLAGDLLPHATEEQILATGFNRNHQQNMEGGIIPEEFRVEYVADRTNTLGKAFLGLTTECARCHDHKYDPITQKEYYQLFSFFNQINEAGQISWDNAMPGPTMLLTDKEVKDKITFIQNKIEQQLAKQKESERTIQAEFDQWIREENYRSIFQNFDPSGLIGYYNLNNADIANKKAPFQKATMRQQHVSSKIQPELTSGIDGMGLLLDGDSWLDLNGLGSFGRAEPFTIELWVNIPEELKNGVLFHKGIGAAIYNYRGFHLALKDDKLELLMARTAPSNAIIEIAPDVPRNQWIQLVMTYDGSSSADGLRIFVNGTEQITDVLNDDLYKGILFGNEVQQEPGLQFGARWRGKGAKGVILDEIKVYDRDLTPLEIMFLSGRQQAPSNWQKNYDQLSVQELAMLREFFLSNKNQQRLLQKKLQDLYSEQFALMDTLNEVMVMGELAKRRKTFVLQRGLYDQYGEEVTPATPAFLPPMLPDMPKNRLGLSQWLTHPDHPLTARVMVNRLWQQFFGSGLVSTSDDFGSQGTRPSHPELLDWLSVTFIKSGWDIQQVIRLIVTSRTYQQQSIASNERKSADPQNRLLARGPSSRLNAEMLRDNILAASDLLYPKIGGKSVKPLQPKGLWRINGGAYIPDTGQNQYRRSLYTFWKRTVPHPVQGTFDAPDRAICTVKRQETNTPLQALVLMNEPGFIAAAQRIGFRVAQDTDFQSGITIAFRRLTGRVPSTEEVQLLEKLQKDYVQLFTESPAKMTGWLTNEDFIAYPNSIKPTLAANAVVANTIINADATIIKR